MWRVLFLFLAIGSLVSTAADAKKPGLPQLKCPPHSTYKLGNNCTDSCNKELMRCTADMWLSCFCDGDWRRGAAQGPYCIDKSFC